VDGPLTPLGILDAALKAQDKRPLWTLDDVCHDLVNGDARIWLGRKSCMVTVESDYPRSGERLIEAWLAGGELSEIVETIPRIEAYARMQGCTQAHVSGRRGWERVLGPHGYDHYATVLRKLL